MEKHNAPINIEIPFEHGHLQYPVIKDDEAAFCLLHGVLDFIDKKHPSLGVTQFFMSFWELEELTLLSPVAFEKSNRYKSEIESKRAKERKRISRYRSLFLDACISWFLMILCCSIVLVFFNKFQENSLILVSSLLGIEFLLIIITGILFSTKNEV